MVLLDPAAGGEQSRGERGDLVGRCEDRLEVPFGPRCGIIRDHDLLGEALEGLRALQPEVDRVAVRSYRNLYLYPAHALTGGAKVEPTIVDLSPLAHDQGESVVISADGTIWMSSEAENQDSQPALGRLRCTLPDD